MSVPQHVNAFRRLKKAFMQWLESQGAEMLGTTNEWELLRYRTPRGVHILYFNKHGRITYCGDTLEHMEAFVGPVNCRTYKPDDPRVHTERGAFAIDYTDFEGDARKHFNDTLKGWGSATDTAREPAEYCSQSEDGREPSADHCEDKPPWE